MDKINILKNLVKFNTIKDKENKQILDYIREQLEIIGLKLDRQEKYLIMSYGEDYNLGFIGHSDTVSYIDGWNTNPFELTQIDNKLYGLGACDMKGGIAAFIQALSEIDLNKLKRGIKVYITYDEECEFEGINDILKLNEKMPEYLIIGEPTDNQMVTGCKGMIAVRMDTKGQKFHSSRTDKGKSANSAMIKLLYELEDFYNKNIKVELDDRFEVPFTTMNVGVIKGGSAMNSISDKCECIADFRTIKSEHMDIIKNKIIELAKKYDANYDFFIDINPFFNDIEFVEEKVTANFMTEASLVKGKRVILGVGPVTAHETNEYLTVESLEKLVEQYKDIIKKTCM